MAINKVIFGDTTVIDISDSTVTGSDVTAGATFYNRSGIKEFGTNTNNADTSDTTATASDVLSGKYFYNSSGVRTVGTLTVPQILYGTTDPTSSQGNDGDLYIKYEE